MRVAIPHSLDPAEVRNRLKSRSHEIKDHLPGGAATVETSWPSEDRMQMDIRTMGQSLVANLVVAENEVVIEMALPGMLSFLEPMISGAIRQQGQKLLGKA
jgi:hypothetical protein